MPPRAAAGLALLAVVVPVAGCGSRAAFSDASFGEVEQALSVGGLHVCAQTKTDDGLANQATSSRTYEVAGDCKGDDRADLIVDEFKDVEDRDAAVRNFEVAVRPTGSGAAWTFGRTSIFVSGTSDDAVYDQVTSVLDGLQAQR